MKFTLVRALPSPKIYRYPVGIVSGGISVSRPSPQQITYYSRDENGKILIGDASSLRRIQYPPKIIDSSGAPLYDLSEGYEKFESYKLDRAAPKMYDLLSVIKSIETTNRARSRAHFLCSRGALVDISSFFGFPASMNIEICCIDGQIVMSTGDYRDEVFTDPNILKGRFSGFKLESLLTSPSSVVQNTIAFKTLVDLKIGDNELIYSAEIDACKSGGSPELSNYLEIKALGRSNNRFKYKRKVYSGALQCLLAGTDEIILGLRDENFKLQSLKKIKIFELVGTWSFSKDPFNLQKSFLFLENVLNWMRSKIDLDENKAWRLTSSPSERILILKEFNDLATVDFLKRRTIGHEFESHRRSLVY